MQMNLMIRITRSFLSLISFATSVISGASIISSFVCSQRRELEIIRKMFRFYHDQLNMLVLSHDKRTGGTLDMLSSLM